MFSFVINMPLGSPVVPLVYIIMQISLFLGSDCSNLLSLPSNKNSFQVYTLSICFTKTRNRISESPTDGKSYCDCGGGWGGVRTYPSLATWLMAGFEKYPFRTPPPPLKFETPRGSEINLNRQSKPTVILHKSNMHEV